jgi:hypothetical protein
MRIAAENGGGVSNPVKKTKKLFMRLLQNLSEKQNKITKCEIGRTEGNCIKSENEQSNSISKIARKVQILRA